jgi:hypothetical protein
MTLNVLVLGGNARNIASVGAKTPSHILQISVGVCAIR